MKIIDLSDRFLRGLLAGFIAAVVMSGLNLAAFFILGADVTRRYYNFVSALVFVRRADTVGEHIFSQIVQLGHGAFMGAIFAYFILGTKSKNHLIKGWIYGMLVLFSVYAMLAVTKLNEILPIDLSIALTHSVTSSVYGIVLAWTLRILDERYDAATETAENSKEGKASAFLKRYIVSPVPARKPQSQPSNEDLENQSRMSIKLYAPVSLKELISKQNKKGLKKPRKI